MKTEGNEILLKSIVRALSQENLRQGVYVGIRGETVILTGRVETKTQSDLIEKIVRGTEGVTNVNNQIKIGLSPSQKMAQRKHSIRSRISGENEMDRTERQIENIFMDENTLDCPFCGAQFDIPSEPDFQCPECGEQISLVIGHLDEFGKLHRHR